MNRPRQENPPLPDRWWLVALVSAMVAVAAAITMLYLPECWSWLVLLALAVFVFTYWLHPALWYRRRAEAAFAIAVVTTLTPGLDAFVHWGPGTLASLVIDTGWPATVFPWLAAIGFGWLDYLSRRPLAAAVSPSSGAQPIHQQTTAVAGPIIAQRVDLTIHQAPVSHAEIPASPASPAQAIPRTHYDLSRILKYAPGELIGREAEIKLLNDAWTKVQNGEPGRPRILSFVALGGEGKTALIAKWVAKLAAQDWPGCDAAFAWSFYSQGTREQMAASSDLFLKKALSFFGDDADKAFAASPAGVFEKGQRLARIVGQRRSLLILDGLEPLQYAPTSPTPGQLKDSGLAALLKGLAAASHGLCVVTTRYSLPDLKAFWPAPPSPAGRGAGGEGTAPEVKLLRLSRDAGVHLLKTLGVTGTTQEFAALVDDVKGHALTLTLLGGFLKRAFHGDIRQRDRVKFEKADEKMDGGHTFRTMAAYEQWLLRDGGDEGRREVAVLRLMGLFDRPADAGCLTALRSETIPGLTEPLAGLADDDWEFCLSGLEAAKLLTVNRDATGALLSLDAHPHIREYFAKQLREQETSSSAFSLQPSAFRLAHRRLYEHLCKHKEGDQPTLEDLQPLYQAVAHGCQAGLQQEACDKVYIARILRGTGSGGNYSTFKLGALGADLGAIACFFQPPWNGVSAALAAPHQAWLLGEASFSLRALGRLTEALEPMRAGLVMSVQQKNWEVAAAKASNVSELELTLGEVAGAVGDAEQSVTYADRSGDADMRMIMRTTHADALHQAGRRAEAETRFREAEQMQAERQPAYPRLYSLRGFRYCDLLLAAPERAAWQALLSHPLPTSPLARGRNIATAPLVRGRQGGGLPAGEGYLDACRAVSQRAAQTLKIGERNNWLLDLALDHLTLGRAALYAAILGNAEWETARRELEAAVSGLRRAGTQDHLPRALLTRAWLRFLDPATDSAGPSTGSGRTALEGAQEDLDEAWEIAERGPMRLFMADIHLHRARLFFREEKYPWTSPQADLAAARQLIDHCGYGRRREELADAEAALVGW